LFAITKFWLHGFQVSNLDRPTRYSRSWLPLFGRRDRQAKTRQFGGLDGGGSQTAHSAT
jgi:hypothetical protein